MNITVRKYNKSDFKLWDKFVENSINGTIFHRRLFLSYHIDRKFNDFSLIFEKKGKIIAVFPAAIEEKDNKKILFSHPGASFGGLVYQKLIFNDAKIIIDLIENYSKEHGFDNTFFIPTPSIYSKSRDETIEYALLWRNYKPIEYYISSVISIHINIEKNIEEIYRLKKRSKTYYKKIIQKNNITFRWENNFDVFYPILVENKKRHDAKPTHSLKELKKIDKLLPGSLCLLIMYTDNKPIGGTLIINANKKTGIIFYNMINYKYSYLQPAILQTIEAIRYAAIKNIKYLDFGVSQDPKADNPLTPSNSLIQFKEETGAFTIIRKAYNKTFTF